jgi:hypothetical protein
MFNTEPTLANPDIWGKNKSSRQLFD